MSTSLKKPTGHTLDKTLTIKVADLPAGDLQLGRVEGSALATLFPGGTVQSGRLALQIDSPTAADIAVIEGAADGTEIGFEVTLKNAAGDVVRSAGVNIPATDVNQIFGAVAFPMDETTFELVEVVVTDPFDPDLTSLIIAWIPDV